MNYYTVSPHVGCGHLSSAYVRWFASGFFCFICAASGSFGQSLTGSVAVQSITGPTEVRGAAYYTANSQVTIVNNTGSARTLFVVTEISIPNGGGTTVVKAPVTVEANSTKNVGNQNGKSVSVGEQGNKNVTAKTKITTDTNDDVTDWFLFSPLAIFVYSDPTPPPDDSYN